MTTIILVSVGILLAAAAALMVVFYGGEAFGAGDVNAQASQLVNAGMNVLAANDVRRAETGEIGRSVSDLVATSHLATAPRITGAVNADAWRLAATATNGDATLYVATGLSADLCRSVLRKLHAPVDPQVYVTGKMGCYSPTSGSYAFYTVLDQAAGASQAKLAGSFDWNGLTDVVPYIYSPTNVPGMTFTGGAGLTRPDTAWLFPASPDGGNLVFLQDSGRVEMDVGALTPGAEYEVRFYVAARPEVLFDGNPDGSDDLDVSYAGRKLSTFHPTSTSFSEVATTRFRAIDGQNKVVFSSETTGRDQSVGFDGVRVVRVS